MSLFFEAFSAFWQISGIFQVLAFYELCSSDMLLVKQKAKKETARGLFSFLPPKWYRCRVNAHTFCTKTRLHGRKWSCLDMPRQCLVYVSFNPAVSDYRMLLNCLSVTCSFIFICLFTNFLISCPLTFLFDWDKHPRFIVLHSIMYRFGFLYREHQILIFGVLTSWYNVSWANFK